MSTGWRCHLASYFGENFLLKTDYIKWCLNHGLVVSKRHLFIRYNHEKSFKDFIYFVSFNCRLGGSDVDKTVVAQTSKVIGNSADGIQLTNKAKFYKTVYLNKLAATKKTSSARFKSYDVIDRNIYDIKISMKTTCRDKPIIVGFVTLHNAKHWMLEFKYDFLEKVILPLTNRAIEVDTNSVYLALTESIIKDCMTGEACDIYTNWVQKNCIDRDYIADDVLNFLPRVCCEKHKKFDTRTTSFFIEWKQT